MFPPCFFTNKPQAAELLLHWLPGTQVMPLPVSKTAVKRCGGFPNLTVGDGKIIEMLGVNCSFNWTNELMLVCEFNSSISGPISQELPLQDGTPKIAFSWDISGWILWFMDGVYKPTNITGKHHQAKKTWIYPSKSSLLRAKWLSKLSNPFGTVHVTL